MARKNKRDGISRWKGKEVKEESRCSAMNLGLWVLRLLAVQNSIAFLKLEMRSMCLWCLLIDSFPFLPRSCVGMVFNNFDFEPDSHGLDMSRS